MKPDLGQLVIYTPPSARSAPQCAAFVARRIDEHLCALMVIGSTGSPFGLPKVMYDPKGSPDSWRYTTDVPDVGELGPGVDPLNVVS